MCRHSNAAETLFNLESEIRNVITCTASHFKIKACFFPSVRRGGIALGWWRRSRGFDFICTPTARRSRGLRSPNGSRAQLNCCLPLSLGGDGSNVETMFQTSTGTLTLLIDIYNQYVGKSFHWWGHDEFQSVTEAGAAAADVFKSHHKKRISAMKKPGCITGHWKWTNAKLKQNVSLKPHLNKSCTLKKVDESH